jgi:ABC-2 type transport system permease protein
MNRNWWTLTWLVAKREITDRARARSFWIASALLLVAVIAGAVIPALLQGSHSTARVGVIDGPAGTLAETAVEAGRISGTGITVVFPTSMAQARSDLLAGSLDAVLVGDREVLVRQQGVFGSSTPGNSLPGALAQIAGLQRLYAALPPAAAASLENRGIAVPVRGLTAPPRGLASRITGLAVAVLMYVIILTYGIRITIGVGEEKASRVVEVLLTALRPVQLLVGKVIGMGLLALAQIVVMVGTYLLLGHAVGTTAIRGTATSVVLAGGLWLILGYAFYCTAFAAAGSLITRQADAYNAALPLQIPLTLAYVLSYTVIYASSVNPFYHVLAFIPFTAPVAMPVLVAVGAAPAWQVAVSAVITVAATAGMARLAGTIYERAILRSGGRLKVRQVLAAGR